MGKKLNNRPESLAQHEIAVLENIIPKMRSDGFTIHDLVYDISTDEYLALFDQRHPQVYEVDVMKDAIVRNIEDFLLSEGFVVEKADQNWFQGEANYTELILDAPGKLLKRHKRSDAYRKMERLNIKKDENATMFAIWTYKARYIPYIFSTLALICSIIGLVIAFLKKG